MLTPDSPDWMRPLGATGIDVCAITIGGSPLGSMPQLYGSAVAADAAVDFVQAVLESPFHTIDTSNGYSDGESERRIGAAIARVGGLGEGRVVITKVDPRDGDYSGARVRESVRESRERLGLDELPLVHLHDPEGWDFAAMTAPGGAVDTLVAMREAGEIGRIGLAGGRVQEIERYFALDVFDALLVHNRWTLVDHSAEALVERAVERGVPVINAAVYGGGILARPEGATHYGYRPASDATLAAVRAMSEACTRYGTDLATAALQASLRDPVVATTVVGATKPERLDGLLRAAAADLPDALFDELDALRPGREHWLDFGD